MTKPNLLLLLASLLTIACSQAKNEKTDLLKDQWTIEPPVIIHQKQIDEQIKDQQLLTSSQFTFESLKNLTDYTLSVKSVCDDKNQNGFVDHFEFKNTNTLKVQQILPHTLLKKPTSQNHPSICSFEFIFKNNKGSTSLLNSFEYEILGLHEFKTFDLENESGKPLLTKDQNKIGPREIERLRLNQLPAVAGSIELHCGDDHESEYFNELRVATISPILHRLGDSDKPKLHLCKLIATTQDQTRFYSQTFSLQRKLKTYLRLNDQWTLKKTKDKVIVDYKISAPANNKDIHVFVNTGNLKNLLLSIAGDVPGELPIKKMPGIKAKFVKVQTDNKDHDMTKSMVRFNSELKLSWEFENHCSTKASQSPSGIRPKHLGYILDIEPMSIFQSLESSGQFNDATDLKDSFDLLSSLPQNLLLINSRSAEELKNRSIQSVSDIYSVGLGLEFYHLCH